MTEAEDVVTEPAFHGDMLTELSALRDELTYMRYQMARIVESVDMLHGRLGSPERQDFIQEAPFPVSPIGYPVLPRQWPVRFGQIAAPDHFLATGWWPREDWGVWSKGVSQLCFSLASDHAARPVHLRLTVQAFSPADRERQELCVTANGYCIGRYTLRGAIQILKIRLPVDCIGNGDIAIELRVEHSLSPQEAEASVDARTLGVGLIMLEML